MKRFKLTTTHIIMLGFLAAALGGSLLLMLPISVKNGPLSFTDALFTSVTSVCVTGLSTVNIGETFTAFGQVVILILIQMGGLGIVTFTTLVLLMLGRRLSLTDRMLMQNAYNLETLQGLVKLTGRIVLVTLIIEMIGGILTCFTLVPEYGPVGIWYSFFHSVSTFCNAGIDLLGQNSLTAYVTNVPMNVITMALIIVSGLGFPVYWEMGSIFKKKQNKDRRSVWSSFSVHARIVIFMTLTLILTGAVFTLVLEFNNPETLGPLSWPQKIMAAFFQSVTLRTAGFATIDQGAFKPVTAFLYLIYMFIGGSPAGTAGGVKTVTIYLMLASMFSNIRGEHHVQVFRRRISDDYVRRAVAICLSSFSILLILTVLLLATGGGDLVDTIYETTSAVATVGLSRGITGSLNTVGKFIIMAGMYLGRIGPITLALAFNARPKDETIRYAETKVIIG